MIYEPRSAGGDNGCDHQESVQCSAGAVNLKPNLQIMKSVRKVFTFRGKKLFVCDMRPGFSEDGVECTLPEGEFELAIEPTQDGKLRGFSLVLSGQSPDAERANGKLSTDMARVGVLDRQAFLRLFDGDGEALFDWSADASGKNENKWGGFLKHQKSGLEAFFVNTLADGECLVQLLRSSSRPVGIRVLPKGPSERAAEQLGSRHWTWVELKCQGIGDPWSFCDDRDFDPDFDLTLEHALFEVSTLCGGAKANPNHPISRYTKRYRGVSKVAAYYECAGEPRRRIRFPASYKIPHIGADATPRKIAGVVFELFKEARRWAKQSQQERNSG